VPVGEMLPTGLKFVLTWPRFGGNQGFDGFWI
jgi:hypothetical protein